MFLNYTQTIRVSDNPIYQHIIFYFETDFCWIGKI